MYEPPCRGTASALLPWYLNGALHGEQNDMVRDHVEGCDICAAELEDLATSVKVVTHPVHSAERLLPENPAPEPARATGRGAWVLAIVLGIPAILGLVWVLLEAARDR